MNYDILIVGSGPGGYVAAIRASQLGFKVGVIEKAELGGICLNWGCIPTKALLKSAQVFNYSKHLADYGLHLEGSVKADFDAIIKRSRNVADNMSKGIQYLFKKNNIEVIYGFGKIKQGKFVEVKDSEGNLNVYSAEKIIIATGSRSRELPDIKQDGKKIIGYREALTLKSLPKSMTVIGSGAIGSEFAYFYNSIGVKVTLLEALPNIIPLEDEEVSKQLERIFKRSGIKVFTDAMVQSVDISGETCKLFVKSRKGEEIIESDLVLSAVGISTNINEIGLEEIGIQVEKGKVIVDNYYKTSIDDYYAIGDIVHGPALAHVASKEGIICVEKIAGHETKSLDYSNIPSCIYTNPEVASVGLTEHKAKENGYEILIGKFPFTASGKATAAGNRDGFVKVVFDKKTDLLLGAHFIGDNVTEMVAEAVIIRKKGITGKEIIDTIHPHPTMSEAIMEAVAAAYNEAIHI